MADLNSLTKAQLIERLENTSDESSGPDERTVIERILDIANEVGVVEATRDPKSGVPFAFRGVDQVVAALTPLLNKHRVFIAPTQVVQGLGQRDVGNKVLTKADLTVSYRAYGARGDYLDFEVPGQADDFADRSTAQAMSVAFRILLLQLFHIAAFGNEESQSQDTMNERDKAGAAKVDAARKTAATATPAPTASAGVEKQAKEMREAIMAAASAKGWSGDKTTEFANTVTGKSLDDWWDDPDLLNQVLVKIHDAS